jgi:hypothetical protein
VSNEFSGVCYSWEEYLTASESASVSEFVIDAVVKVSTRFATKDIASRTSLTLRLLTHLPDDSSDGFTSKTTWPVARYVRDSLALSWKIIIICKSRYFNMLALANQLIREELEQTDRSRAVVIPGRNNRLPRIHWTQR